MELIKPLSLMLSIKIKIDHNKKIKYIKTILFVHQIDFYGFIHLVVTLDSVIYTNI